MPEGALNLAGFNEDSAENIHENRRRFLGLFGGRWLLTSVWQIHGSNVRHVQTVEEARNDTETFDAIVAPLPDVLLGVKTADCVPLLIADPSKGVVSAVHAGWRGLVSGIVPNALRLMRDEYGSRPEDLIVALGPAARACCYEVGQDVIEAIGRAFGDQDGLLVATREGHALLDLHRAAASQLLQLGVNEDNLHIAPLCTMCRTDLFFSYRREKRLNGRVGRLMSVIGRASASPSR